MSISAPYTRTFVVAGLTFSAVRSVTSDLAIPWSVTAAAAKTGTLTTRATDVAGTLTMDSGHGITTGQRLDIFWSGGSAYGATVGTVSSNSVPFTLAEGDALPIATTAITAQVPSEQALTVSGSAVVSIACSCPLGGTVVFATSGNVTCGAVQLTATATSYVYTTSDGGTNPLSGDSVAKIFISSRDSGASSLLTGCVQYD